MDLFTPSLSVDSADKEESSCSVSRCILSRYPCTDSLGNKIFLEQPTVPSNGDSRYLTPLWVSENVELVDELHLSDSSQAKTMDFKPGAENSVKPHQKIKEKIRATLKLLAFRGQHVLVQFWSPRDAVKHQPLTTIDQPFGLADVDDGLLSYRKETEHNVFYVDKNYTGKYLSPPARVFRLGIPEFSFDLINYSQKYFPQKECAIRQNLHGYLALPVFELSTKSCVGVLELLTSSEHTSFAYEVQHIQLVLKTQNLTCAQVYNGPASNVQRQTEFGKMFRIMKDVCDRHKLPLAQSWALSPSTSFVSHDNIIVKSCSSFDKYCIGKDCMSTSSLPYYARDLTMWPYREASRRRHLDPSQGVVGKALESRGSCICVDVTELDDVEYPLVYNARMSKLTGCFGIFLHNFKVNEDYVMEFFLPSDMKDVSSVVQTLRQRTEDTIGFKLGHTSYIQKVGTPADFSDLESTLIDISDTESTNNVSMKKRRASTFPDDGETSSPLKRIKIDSNPVQSVTVQVTFKEYTINFLFPVPPGLLELRSGVEQMFKLEGKRFSLKYWDNEDDLISILSAADLDFAISGGKGVSLICEQVSVW